MRSAHKRHKGGNHIPVISDAVKRLIADLQSAHHTLRLQDIHDALDVTILDTPPCIQTLWNVLHAAGFTTKALSKHAASRNTLATKESRRTWCINDGPKLHADTVIFIDESPFSFCITRTRGRSRKGQPAITITPQIRGKNHTMIAAISPTRGLLYHAVHVTQPSEEFISRRKGSKKRKTGPRGVTHGVMRSFLIDLLARPPLSDRSTTFTLVLDNGAIYKGDIQEAIFQVGHTCFSPGRLHSIRSSTHSRSGNWRIACIMRTRRRRSTSRLRRQLLRSRRSTACIGLNTPSPCMIPTNEDARVHALLQYRVMDTQAEHAFDQLAVLASQICTNTNRQPCDRMLCLSPVLTLLCCGSPSRRRLSGATPMALVSLVDHDRQWFKARIGIEPCETSRDLAFCAHAILQDDVFEIPDTTQDFRFAHSPLVTGAPKIRFYAGMPLINHDGYPLGTLCVLDTQPKQLTADQKKALKILSQQTVAQLELRRYVARLTETMVQLHDTKTALQEESTRLAHIVREESKRVKQEAEKAQATKSEFFAVNRRTRACMMKGRGRAGGELISRYLLSPVVSA
jgi:GAF domain-containing protein